jgi:hypothetical protein
MKLHAAKKRGWLETEERPAVVVIVVAMRVMTMPADMDGVMPARMSATVATAAMPAARGAANAGAAANIIATMRTTKNLRMELLAV